MTLKYLTRKSLAEEAGVGVSTLDRHIEQNICGIAKAREEEKGAGVRFNRERAAKYIAWMSAARKKSPSAP